jgi:hypothetical protein
MRKFSSWSDMLISIVIYGGIAFVVIAALSPILLVIFQGDADAIPGPFGNCDPEFNDCQP